MVRFSKILICAISSKKLIESTKLFKYSVLTCLKVAASGTGMTHSFETSRIASFSTFGKKLISSRMASALAGSQVLSVSSRTVEKHGWGDEMLYPNRSSDEICVFWLNLRKWIVFLAIRSDSSRGALITR
uniref:(northern house mosquito) hypothetical protein n=1 Tax=Culex pipiens TaxID=7175 RepID=A0A8D8NE09_CULPI